VGESITIENNRKKSADLVIINAYFYPLTTNQYYGATHMPPRPLLRPALQAILAVLCALALALAPLPAPLALANTDLYEIRLSTGRVKEMCVGQSIWIEGTFNTKYGQIAQLIGPEIRTLALGGQTTPLRIFTGSGGGTFHFKYTAKEAGMDTIFATIQGTSINREAGTQVKINVVEKCAYKFDLNVEMNAVAQDEGALEIIKYTMRIRGTMKMEAGSGSKMKAYPTIQFRTEMIEYIVPDCTLVSPNVARGMGFSEVTGELVDDGEFLDVWFDPPEDLRTDFTVQAICNGEGITFNRVVPLTSKANPWIEASFPSQGGSKEVKVDFFDQGVKNFQQAGHTASYKGILKVERVTK
jgi:hypothetical protein